MMSQERSWLFWPLLPIYPYGRRRTFCTEVVKDQVWCFDQLQGIFYVIVPVRMTVVRLQPEGLLIYAPVAPTRECIGQLRQLEAQYGPVKYIISPTVTGLEHKVFVGPFARQCPQAQIYVAPNQWSFPLNLPLSWLGLPSDRTQVLPTDSSQAPFFDQFDYKILGPIALGLGPFVEVVFFHRASRSLLVTDSVVSVPAEPPEILQQEPFPLLFHSRDTPSEPMQDTPENRRKGWQRICLFAFYFRPSVLEVATTGDMLREARNAPDRSRRNYFGWYPFRWQPGWQMAFTALRGGGRLFVAPVLQTLIFNRGSQQVLAWADEVAKWQFERIIPCHLDAPVVANPQQFRAAFRFLETQPSPQLGAHDIFPLPEVDFSLLRDLEQGLTRRGVTPPPR
jgi:hypothetical protein